MPNISDIVTSEMLYVVLNPYAGQGAAIQAWPKIAHELLTRGVAFRRLQGEHASDICRQIDDLPEQATLLVVGGDGTVSALLPALLHTKRKLALVPYGSGNDLAGMLKIQNLEDTLNQLKQPPRKLDVLRMNWHYADTHANTCTHTHETSHTLFAINGIGMGFDAEVNRSMQQIPQSLDNLLSGTLGGFGRYLWGALDTLRKLHFETVSIQVDQQEVYHGPSALAAVMNGKRYGGGFMISPKSLPDDGLLDVLCSRGPLSRVQFLQLMFLVLNGAHLEHPQVCYERGRTVNIRWKKPIALQSDGDMLENIQEIEINVEPQAIWVYAATS